VKYEEEDDGMTMKLREIFTATVDKAQAEGKLKPIEDAIKSLNLNIDAKTLFVAAQMTDETKGRSPEELASMLKDPEIVRVVMVKADLPPKSGMGEEPTEEEAMPSVGMKMMKMKKEAEMSDMADEGIEDDEKAKSYRMRMGM
jgi:hypothetical protein